MTCCWLPICTRATCCKLSGSHGSRSTRSRSSAIVPTTRRNISSTAKDEWPPLQTRQSDALPTSSKSMLSASSCGCSRALRYPAASTIVPRYHFDEFVLSSRRRLLLRGAKEQPLIPRYFDLLVFLVEHRHEAVHRRDIFDRVWTDAIVSDSALSQAIRTIRRVLGDDPREPRFIGTVSRHGYRFVFAEVREEDDDGAWPPAVAAGPAVVEAVVVAL